MKQVKCPNCGATFDVIETASFSTCPYCGYTFNIQTLQEWTHYFFPVYFNQNSAWLKLRSFILRRYGVPHDFYESSNINNITLHYVPLHIFHAEAEATCQHKKSSATYHKVLDLTVPAYSGFWFDSILRSHKFSVRGKTFFKPSILEKGKYYPPSISSESAKNLSQSIITSLVLREANESCRGYSQVSKVDVNYIGLVHYPIWEFYYSYKNESFKGLIDGTNGRVMFVEYPLSREAKTFLLVSSVAIVTASSLGGMLIGLVLVGNAILGFCLGLVGSLASSAPLLLTAFSLKERGSEEISKKDSLLSAVEWASLVEKFIGFRTNVPITFDL
ncbi:MAG: zinc ribbon domain-containing protein [Thermoproteota archaeon]|nr:zinc ribbon domain-containing protein [Candidatus Brockarchaeota archaeon]MBO3802096.1 zinc ribbon domain-containing protein [Candidatus Brockarchaeota archaeon]